MVQLNEVGSESYSGTNQGVVGSSPTGTTKYLKLKFMYLVINEGINLNDDNYKPVFLLSYFESLENAINSINEDVESQKRLEQHVKIDTYDCIKEHIQMTDEYFKFYNVLYVAHVVNKISNYLTKRFVIEV